MKSDPGYIRELGNAEFFYYICNKLAPTNFVVVVELNETIKADALTKAANGFSKTYDIFHVKIVTESSTKPAFWNTDYQSIGTRVRLDNRSSLHSTILEEVNTPMSPESTPLRLVIFNESNSKIQHLLFTFNHLFNDASSAVVLVQKVVAYAISGKEHMDVKRNRVASNLEQLIPSPRYGLTFLKAIFTMVRRVRKMEKTYGKLEHTVTGRYNFHYRNLTFMQAGLDRRGTGNLVELARNNGLTVHHLLSAIQLMSARRLYAEKGTLPLTLSMPVNIRGMLNPEVDKATPGLYISIPKLMIPVSDTPGLMEVAKEVKSDLERTIRSKELFILWRLLPRSRFPDNEKGLNKMNSTFSKSVDSTMITNIGAVPLLPELESANPIHSLYFAVAPPKDAMLCLAVSTYMGKMKLSFCFNRDLLTNGDCKRVFQDFKNELTAITN